MREKCPKGLVFIFRRKRQINEFSDKKIMAKYSKTKGSSAKRNIKESHSYARLINEMHIA